MNFADYKPSHLCFTSFVVLLKKSPDKSSGLPFFFCVCVLFWGYIQGFLGSCYQCNKPWINTHLLCRLFVAISCCCNSLGDFLNASFLDMKY